MVCVMSTPETLSIKKVCANCGSENVWVDATAAWDVENQGWELAFTSLDHAVCADCGGEGVALNDVNMNVE